MQIPVWNNDNDDKYIDVFLEIVAIVIVKISFQIPACTCRKKGEFAS